MPDWISQGDFHAADGVDDWRMLAVSATAFFRTVSFPDASALVSAIAALDGVTADVDVRPDGVTVRLMAVGYGTPSDDKGFPATIVDDARRVSAVARDLGATADPSRVQDVQLTLDARSTPTVRSFWCAVLGYDPIEDEDAVDPRRIGPPIWFQDMDPVRSDRNRFHVDVFVPHDELDARVDAGVAAGGTIIRDMRPTWVTLADPEGNEVDLTNWRGRD